MVKTINGDLYSDLITSSNDNLMPSGSRGGFGIEYIVIHHNATTNKDVAMGTWYSNNGGGTSAHYEITPNEIIGCVGENFSAWHAGGTGGSDIPKIPNINARSIGLEHVNSTGAPYWNVADETLANSAKLVADICKRYNIPIDRKHILRHGEITATACCGGLDVDKLVRMAQNIANGGGNQTTTATTTQTAQENKGEQATMTDGLFSIKDDHAGYKKGDMIYWSSVSGFKYLQDPDNVKLLKMFNPRIVTVDSSAGAPFIVRGAQINNTNFGKR